MKRFQLLLAVLSLCLATTSAFAWVSKDVHTFLDHLNAQPGKPIEQLPPHEARDILISAQKHTPADVSGVDVQQKTIMVKDKKISLIIVRPANIKKTLPVFMFFHGGGWVLGDYQTHQRLVRDLVLGSGAAAVFVNYTLSPEAHYPTAIEQAFEATKWVANHGKEINVDGSRLAVVGNSVGGNMATVMTLMSKEKNGPLIKFQALLWPVTAANFDTDSYKQFSQGYFLTKNMMQWFWNNYTTDKKERLEIYASPLRATLEQLQGLPPALIITAENDVLRDEGETYGKNLDAASVPVTVVRYLGVIHDFGMLNDLSQTPQSKAAIAQVAEELKRRLK